MRHSVALPWATKLGPSRRGRGAGRRRPGFSWWSGGGGRRGRCTVVPACGPSSPAGYGPLRPRT